MARRPGTSGNDDSGHARLDGAETPSADRMDGFNNTNWV